MLKRLHACPSSTYSSALSTPCSRQALCPPSTSYTVHHQAVHQHWQEQRTEQISRKFNQHSRWIVPHAGPKCETKPKLKTQQLGTVKADKALAQEQEQVLQASKAHDKDKGYASLAAWVAAATAFGAGIWYYQGPVKAQEYFAGYLLEQSLSVDNLFVFIMVFNYFKTPPAAQPKVLSWGIVTAAVLRAVMIVAGVELVDNFRPVLAVFAAILIFSAYQLLTGEEDKDEELADNAVVKVCKSLIKCTDEYDGDKFFTTGPDGISKVATPLLLTLAVVELSDVVFAVDSIPAVFGVTLDPFIIYTSNLFAILSLRSLYTFVSTAMTELRYLDKSVAVVLGFIGSKMLLDFADIEISTSASLMVVGLVLGGGVAASLLLPEEKESSE